LADIEEVIFGYPWHLSPALSPAEFKTLLFQHFQKRSLQVPMQHYLQQPQLPLKYFRVIIFA